MDHRFVRVIGEGAFSRVYLVEDGRGQRYACKISRETKILEREAEILSRLYHPLFPRHIGYEKKEDVGRLFMEYISGKNLGQMVRLRGGFSARQTMKIAEELVDGLRYLQERQPAILYRDLKPENIMVCENGHIKIIDFGCACYLDEQGKEKVGSPGFAPPEQLIAGVSAGLYSDVYGLGRTIQSVMAEKEMEGGERRENHSKGQKCYGGKRKRHLAGQRDRVEESGCRYRLERMIEESTCEDFRQRPQDMISISHMLIGKREEGIVCEKNIWESSYKNSCSLPLIWYT